MKTTMTKEKGNTAPLSKRLFDPKLYAEGLRQLRVLGILYLVIMEIGILLYSAQLSQRKYPIPDYRPHSLFLLGGMAMSGLMVLYLFRFLNRRESCDFYHALPHTRTSLFLSFYCAALTWSAAGLLLPTVSQPLFLYAFFHRTGGFPVSAVGDILAQFLFGLAAMLFVAAVTALAMSLTGTTLSNMLAAGLFVLAPRTLVMVYMSAVQSILPILPSRSESLFDLHYNPIFYLIEYPGSAEPTAILYSLVIGLLYTALAVFLFCRRRSETAGQAARNRFLQAVFRLLLAMLICLYPCVRIVQGKYDDSNALLLVTVYIAAVIVYFLYELITTRKVKNLIRAVPSLGILLIMNVAFVGSLAGIREVILSQTPNAEEVQSIVFRSVSSASGYLEARATNISVEDKNTIYQVTNRLKEEVWTLRENSRYASRYPLYSDLTREVELHTDSGVIRRVLTFSLSENEQIVNKLQQEEAYRKAYMELPPSSGGEISVSIRGLAESQASALYEQLRQEVNEIGFDQWHDIVQNSFTYDSFLLNREDGILHFSNLYISGQVKGEWHTTAITLSTKLPRTLEAYLKYTNEANRKAVLKGIWEKDAAIYFKKSGLSVSETSDYYISQFSGADETALRAFLEGLLRQSEADPEQPVDPSKPLYVIAVTKYGDQERVVYLNAEEDIEPPADQTGAAGPTVVSAFPE